MYNECIQITRQFAFCPNAFRIDLYRGCGFGCKYCFANMDWTQYGDRNSDVADITKIQKLFYKALETDKESKDILVELIRHKVPIHCGGMSDPFQKREFDLHLTKQLLELSCKYGYPVQFSTKTDYLPDDYLTLLNPKIHAVQVSIMGWDDEYIRKWECNTPTAKQRADFVKQLRQLGIFIGIRIQPIIDIVQVEKMLYNVRDEVDYYTVEHLKFVWDTEAVDKAFFKLADNKIDFTTTDHKLQFKRPVKIKNIKRIQEIANSFGVEVGVGDNDLHWMTQGKTCCGIDKIPGFENHLKYNLCCFSTGNIDKGTFIPQCNPRKHINDQKYGLKIDCKQYTEDYIKNHLDYLGPNREHIEKQLFGKTKRRLF